MAKLSIGCHVSAAGGVFNAPGNAAALGCETFQIFTRPPMGGNAPKLTDEIVGKFKEEMEKYYPLPTATPLSLAHSTGLRATVSAVEPVGGTRDISPQKGRKLQPAVNPSPSDPFGKAQGHPERSRSGEERGRGEVVFVVHCPYFVNFGSKEARIYHGSISVVGEEMSRANSLGAKYVMTHLGSGKDLGEKAALKQAKEGLAEVLKKYKGDTQFLLEIAAGAGATLGGTFEQLAELMEPLVKFKTFGGICFDTQHAFASGYDLRDATAVTQTFKAFNKIIGLKWLKMSHINDSKIEFGGKKDRHEHIGDGKIGEKGFLALVSYFKNLSHPSAALGAPSPSFGEGDKVASGATALDMPLIFETEHDKVEKDMEILRKLRNKVK